MPRLIVTSSFTLLLFARFFFFQGERNFHILYELVAGGAASGLASELKVRQQRRNEARARIGSRTTVARTSVLLLLGFCCHGTPFATPAWYAPGVILLVFTLRLRFIKRNLPLQTTLRERRSCASV